MLWQWFSCDQENYREDDKNDNKPFSNCLCNPADKSKNHKYDGNEAEQYSKH